MAFTALMLSGDRTVLEAGSAVRARLKRYTSHMDGLVVVVTGLGEPKVISDGSVEIRFPGGSSLAQNFFRIARDARRASRGANVVTAQDPYFIGLAALYAAWGRAPLQIQIHGALFNTAFVFESVRHFVEAGVAVLVLSLASCVRAVSLQVAEAARRVTRAPIVVLPVSAELSQFTGSHPRPAEYGDHPVLLAVSRLAHEKNFPLMLRALTQVPEAHLYIAGEGHERNHIASLAQSLGLGARVHFLGFKRPIAPYMAHADAVVVSSLYESYCLTLIESVAAGTPVVTVDVGVARELPQSMVTIVPPDSKQMGGAIQDVLRAPPAVEVRETAKTALSARLYSEEETARRFVDSLRTCGAA